MTDIVQQLRQRDGDWICEKAADEIELLRGALETLMEQPTKSPLSMTPPERERLWAAHEKARAALKPIKATIGYGP